MVKIRMDIHTYIYSVTYKYIRRGKFSGGVFQKQLPILGLGGVRLGGEEGGRGGGIEKGRIPKISEK